MEELLTGHNAKDMSYENVRLKHCPLCGSTSIHKLYHINRFSVPFGIDQCETCSFIFMNPCFSDDELQGMYSKEYYDGSAEYSYIDERKNEKYSTYVWNARIRHLQRFIPGGRFLDIGCAFGGFMNAASSLFSVYGIEQSKYAGAIAAQRFPGKVHIGTLDNNPFPEKSFSVISMIEVIEHIPDPVKALKQCYSLLDKGGVLMIQTANMDGIQAKLARDKYHYFLPGHVSYFSRKNIEQACIECGFSRVIFFFPVEFGLLPKFLKSRGSFSSVFDYRAWLRIAFYHLIGKIHFKDFALTSSMVLYAIK